MSEPYAVYVQRIGGPEVLEARPMARPLPEPGQVVIQHTAVSVNFVDIYLRSGQPHSHNPEPPFIPGVSAVGKVVAVGVDVEGVAIGDRVTYANAGVGSYCTHVAVAADRVVKIPGNLSDERVAAGLVRALTAQYLLKQMRPLRQGDTVLVHAAAGGVGQLLVQWAKRLGLVVIATAGSDEKVALVKSLGADAVINYRDHDFVIEVNRLTEGKGVAVAYDSVGHDTFMGSLACLAPRGLAVNFGTASGHVEPFPLQMLHARSLSVCRPTLRTYIAERRDLLAMCEEVFGFLADPAIHLTIDARLPLKDAAKAHALMEKRQTQGAVVLTIP